MTHSLINVFSQIVIGGNQCVLFVCRVIIIVIAVVLSKQERKKESKINSENTTKNAIQIP